MKQKLTFLSAVGCLFALTLTTSCNKPEEKTVYATNKAGERLVEKIVRYSEDTIYFKYNSDGTIKTIEGYESNSLYSFERKGNTLFMHEDSEEFESSFDLNEKGWIVLDRGWDGSQNYHLSYDANGYLHDVFDGEELLWTFEWKDGNIVNEEVTYIPTQAKSSNIDWCAFFQSWRHKETFETEVLVDVPSISIGWCFEGYLGNKNQGLPLTTYNGKRKYSYDFDEDGFVSTIYIDGDPAYQITYLKK